MKAIPVLYMKQSEAIYQRNYVSWEKGGSELHCSYVFGLPPTTRHVALKNESRLTSLDVRIL